MYLALKHLVFLELAHVQRSVQQCPKCNCFVMRIKGLKGEDSSNPAMLEAEYFQKQWPFCLVSKMSPQHPPP